MASLFESLPPEIVQKCVECLDFDFVSGDLKAVSKATRGVARRALTRGRWKPIRYVAAEGLAFCTPARPADDLRDVDIDPPPPAASATFREAWALDPALVVRAICDWNTDRIGRGSGSWHRFRMMRARGYYQARFLSIVAPAADGLSRVVSAVEGTYLIQFESTDYGLGPGRERGRWPFFPFCMLSELAKAHDPKISPWELAPLIGIGLEAWADPILAAKFTHRYFCSYLRAESTRIMAEIWSDRWEDRAKASMFMAELNRLIPPADSDSDSDDHPDYYNSDPDY